MTVKLSTLANPKATSGTPVEVRDEGVQKTTGVSSFDFVGAGVTVTATGGAVEVNIPGGGAGGIQTYIQNATPTITPGDKALWIQTGLGTNGTDITFWVEDGL